MTQEQILQKVKDIQAEWADKLGEITDIWLPPDLLDILDGRPLLERVQDPLQIGDIYITPFRPLHDNQVRIAFLTEVDFEPPEGDPTDESISTNRSTSSSE